MAVGDVESYRVVEWFLGGEKDMSMMLKGEGVNPLIIINISLVPLFAYVP